MAQRAVGDDGASFKEKSRTDSTAPAAHRSLYGRGSRKAAGCAPSSVGVDGSRGVCRHLERVIAFISTAPRAWRERLDGCTPSPQRVRRTRAVTHPRFPGKSENEDRQLRPGAPAGSRELPVGVRSPPVRARLLTCPAERPTRRPVTQSSVCVLEEMPWAGVSGMKEKRAHTAGRPLPHACDAARTPTPLACWSL